MEGLPWPPLTDDLICGMTPRSLFDKVRGDILVTGVERGERPVFHVVWLDGETSEAPIRLRSSPIIKNDGPGYRIYGVPLDAKHRIYWLTGPCAWPLARLATVGDPEVQRYVKRERRKIALRCLMFWRTE
jgi:hypothetical protein